MINTLGQEIFNNAPEPRGLLSGTVSNELDYIIRITLITYEQFPKK